MVLADFFSCGLLPKSRPTSRLSFKMVTVFFPPTGVLRVASLDWGKCGVSIDKGLSAWFAARLSAGLSGSSRSWSLGGADSCSDCLETLRLSW